MTVSQPGISPVPAMDLRPADVVHIGPHTVHGMPVDCADQDVEVTAVRWGDEAHREVVLDYGPSWVFPGEPSAPKGSVVYPRLAMIPVLWRGDPDAAGYAAMALSQVTALAGMVA